MTGTSPPLRFLTLVIAGWICLRAALLASAWWQQPVRAAPAEAGEARPAPAPLPERSAPSLQARTLAPEEGRPLSASKTLSRVEAAISPLYRSVLEATAPDRPAPPSPVPTYPPASAPPTFSPPASGAGRWSGSAWLFVREGRSGTLAPGGMLGGSQAGGRIAYRLSRDTERPLALSGRVYAPLDRPQGAEAAAGIDWKPLAGAPLHLLAERRIALGGEGRDAFALMAYGGFGETPVGPLRLDAYAQAGMVGLKSRDLFADGSAKLSLPAGRVRLGAGAWGAAQPGVSRLDVGPQASVHVPLGGTAVVVAVDWRLRAAGDAAPGSGPSLTISAGF